MPIQIHNDSTSLSLLDLVRLKEAGYSVVKSPHVGNQHPSNLLCARLGFDLNMVSFTQGKLDSNFHPHLKIAQGNHVQIADPTAWTPFSRLSCGRSVEEFHQEAVKRRFPNALVRTDMEIIAKEMRLAEAVLRVVPSDWWYRFVDTDGSVTKLSELPEQPVLSWPVLQNDIFGVTNQSAGWVVPMKAHIVLQFTLQSLSSGKSTIYHLAGPQMTGYIGKMQGQLSKVYDRLRDEYSSLPEVLEVKVVPVAACRMLDHVKNSEAVMELEQTLLWYESLPNEEKRYASERFQEVISRHRDFVLPIESGCTLSQYDLDDANDLAVSMWMMTSSLGRVRSVYNRLSKMATSDR